MYVGLQLNLVQGRIFLHPVVLLPELCMQITTCLWYMHEIISTLTLMTRNLIGSFSYYFLFFYIYFLIFYFFYFLQFFSSWLKVTGTQACGSGINYSILAALINANSTELLLQLLTNSSIQTLARDSSQLEKLVSYSCTF